MPRLKIIDATHTHVFNCFHLLTECQEPAIMACCWSHFIVIGSLSRIWLHTFLIHLNWRPCWVYHWKYQISEPQIPPHQTPWLHWPNPFIAHFKSHWIIPITVDPLISCPNMYTVHTLSINILIKTQSPAISWTICEIICCRYIILYSYLKISTNTSFMVNSWLIVHYIFLATLNMYIYIYTHTYVYIFGIPSRYP